MSTLSAVLYITLASSMRSSPHVCMVGGNENPGESSETYAAPRTAGTVRRPETGIFHEPAPRQIRRFEKWETGVGTRYGLLASLSQRSGRNTRTYIQRNDISSIEGWVRIEIVISSLDILLVLSNTYYRILSALPKVEIRVTVLRHSKAETRGDFSDMHLHDCHAILMFYIRAHTNSGNDGSNTAQISTSAD